MTLIARHCLMYLALRLVDGWKENMPTPFSSFSCATTFPHTYSYSPALRGSKPQPATVLGCAVRNSRSLAFFSLPAPSSAVDGAPPTYAVIVIIDPFHWGRVLRQRVLDGSLSARQYSYMAHTISSHLQPLLHDFFFF